MGKRRKRRGGNVTQLDLLYTTLAELAMDTLPFTAAIPPGREKRKQNFSVNVAIHFPQPVFARHCAFVHCIVTQFLSLFILLVVYLTTLSTAPIRLT